MAGEGGGFPAGTVTFLFTDIQGSTRLFQQIGAAYPDLLERHRQLLRAAVAAHDGHEVGTDGDGCLFVFGSASSAISAAAAGQAALGAELWPGETLLRVRMGIHTGEAHPVDGDYTAIAVHQAARVAAAAHGGQVICSAATGDLAIAPITASWSLKSLGQFTLKDFDRPERLYQLTGDALLDGFPPLRVPTARHHNLPEPRTSFVGRAEELEALEALVLSNPLVTVVGTGGCGKTRLALEVAATRVHACRDGVWFVDLAALRDAGLVDSHIGQALAIEEQAGISMRETLVRALAVKSSLLVLDNCEHLIDACADIVDEILRSCPEISILATSREALGVPGERPWRMPSLSLPTAADAEAELTSDAVTLFAERAAQARPGFSLTPGNLKAVVAICRRLDGIPLAIELAAARLAALSPAQLLDRLDDYYAILTGGSRVALERQHTLRALVDWSHQLLSDEEQVVFRRLSVFAASFSLEAAEAVVEGSLVLDAVAALVSKSLLTVVEQGDEIGYRMLDMIRQFAWEKLQTSGDGPDLRLRHRDYFLALLESQLDAIPHVSVRSVLDLIDAVHADLRAAFEWSMARSDEDAALRFCRAAGLYWIGRSQMTEGEQWTRAALELGGDSPSLSRADVLSYAARISELKDGGSDDLLAQARAAYETLAAAAPDDPKLRSRVLHARVGECANDERIEVQQQAVEATREAVRRGLEKPRALFGDLVQLVNAYAGLRRVAPARAVLAEADAITEIDPWDRFYFCYHGSRIEFEDDQLEAAMGLIDEACALATACGDDRLRGEADHMRSTILAALERYDEAIDAARASLLSHQRAGRRPFVMNAINNLLYLALRAGDAVLLSHYAAEAQQYLPDADPYLIHTLGEVARCEGRLGRAAELFDRAIQVAEAAGPRYGTTSGRCSLVALHAWSGAVRAGREGIRAALTDLDSRPLETGRARAEVGDLLWTTALVAWRAGDRPTAAALLAATDAAGLRPRPNMFFTGARDVDVVARDLGLTAIASDERTTEELVALIRAWEPAVDSVDPIAPPQLHG